MNEREDGAPDVLNATRAAVADSFDLGVDCSLFGCISALDSLKDDNKDQGMGVGIIQGHFKIPAVTIAEKADVEGSFIVREILQSSSEVDYNVILGECENTRKGNH